MKIYLAGPMTGYPDHNFPAFMKKAAELRKLGLEVVNPAEIENDQDDWVKCMKDDIKQLVDCDAIFMMKNWGKSKGARLEHTIAFKLKLYILYEEDDYNGHE